MSTLVIKVDSRAGTAEVVKMRKELRGLRDDGNKATGSVDKLSTGFSKLKGTAAFAAVAAGLTASVKLSAQFEKSIAEVNTLLGNTQSIDKYRDSILSLSKEFGVDQAEQARAMYQVISAGADSATEATNILTAANKLALGGVTNITTAADGLTSVINAYGLEANQASAVSDAFFVAMKAGKTTIGELSSSIGLVAPLAKEMGLAFDETVGAVSALTKGGVKTAQAVTQIRAALTAVIKPASEAEKLADKLGLAFNSQALASKGLAGFLQEVQEKTGGNKEEMAKLFGSVEALNAVLALSGSQAQSYADIMGQMRNKTGAADEAVAKMQDTVSFKWDAFITNAKDAAIQLGDFLAPATKTAIDFLNGLVDAARTSGEGLAILFDFAKPLFNLLSDSKSFSIASNGFIEVSDSVGKTSIAVEYLQEVFSGSQVVGIALVEGLLVAWEQLKYGSEVAFEGIKFAFSYAIDAMRAQYAGFIEMVGKGLFDVPFMEGASESILQFSQTVGGAQSSVSDYAAKLMQLSDEKDVAIGKIKEITQDLADYYGETEKAAEKTADIKTEVVAAKEEFKKLAPAVSDSTGSVSAFDKSMSEFVKKLNQLPVDLEISKAKLMLLNSEFAKGKISPKQYEKILKSLGLEANKLNKILEDQGLKVKGVDKAYKDIVGSLEETAKRQGILNNEGQTGVEVYDQLKRAADRHGVTVDELTRKYPQLSEEIRRNNEEAANNRAAREAVQGFADDVGNILVRGGDLGDYLKDLWKRIAADLISSGIIKLINSIFGTSISSGGTDYGALIGAFLGGSGSGGSGNSGSSVNLSGGGTYGNAVGAANSAVDTYNSYQSGDYLGTATSGYATYTQAQTAYNSWLASQGATQGAVYGGQITSTATYGGTVSSGAAASGGTAAQSAAASQGSTAASGSSAGGASAASWAVPLAAAAVFYTVIDSMQGGRTPQAIARDQARELRGGNIYTDEKESGFVQSIDYDGGGNLKEIGDTRTLSTGFLDREEGIETFSGGREGFFEGTGYQELGALASSRGLEVIDYGNGIKVAAHNQEELNQLMAEYDEQVSRSKITSEEFHGLLQSGAIKSGETLTNNVTRILGGTVETSKAALVEADKLFDGYVASGTSAHDAVYAALSKTLGLSIDETEKFVEAAGLSARDFERFFESGSGSALGNIERFRDGGSEAMESLSSDAERFGRRFQDSVSEAVRSAEEDISRLSVSGDVRIRTSGGKAAQNLGDASSALFTSKTFDVPNYSGDYKANGVDKQYMLGLVPGREQATVHPTGALESISAQVDNLKNSVELNSFNQLSDDGLKERLDKIAYLLEAQIEANESQQIESQI